MPYFPIKTYLCDIGLCKIKVDNSEKISPESAFLVPTKGELVQTRRDANANLCLSYRPAKFFNRIFTRLCP